MPNVILTPHNSFIDDGNERRLNGVVVKNISEFASHVDTKGKEI